MGEGWKERGGGRERKNSLMLPFDYNLTIVRWILTWCRWSNSFQVLTGPHRGDTTSFILAHTVT